METLRNWATQWGDLASVFGVALTTIGFAVTLFAVWRSKNAAEQARLAAQGVITSFAHYDAIADLSSAMVIMDEIKRLQRHGAWAILPDRYSELRRRLVAIKGSGAPLNDLQRLVLQSAIEAFADLERRIEKAVLASIPPAKPAKLNDIVSGQIDEVNAVLLHMQRMLRSGL